MLRTVPLCAGGFLALSFLFIHAAGADQITDLAASAPTGYGTAAGWPTQAVDGTGLTGGDHTDNWGDGWLTEGAINVDDQYFLIDLKRYCNLDTTGTLKFWNGRFNSGNTGMQTVNIYASTDGINWGSALPVTFRDSGGNPVGVMNKASGSTFDGTIDLNQAVTARYLKLDVNGGQGVGNYGDGTYVGLAEIQVFGTPAAATPGVADQIVLGPGSVTCTSGGYGKLDAVVDGSGLTGEQHAANNYDHQFMAQTADGQVAFTFDLGASQKLEAMKIWNYNHATYGYGKTGMRTVDILVANQSDFSDAEVAYDDIELTMSTGKDDYDNAFLVNLRDSAMSGTNYRYVRISSIGNANPFFSGAPVSGYAGGLAEVQFFQTYVDVPEPATAALLAVGLVGLLRRRRK